ncbi:hypothetical protein MRB53_033042 [Persea americana]|uniref:Uncharacterized protein n=1 Tax=Persea americana TaxID=3435 RepID=A0ACC2KUL7_PERAE|nr:hypothetical protein MRB53_033042 [Persea americana]
MAPTTACSPQQRCGASRTQNRPLPAVFFLSGSCAGVQQHSDTSSAVLAIFFSGETRSPSIRLAPCSFLRSAPVTSSGSDSKATRTATAIITGLLQFRHRRRRRSSSFL